MYDGGSMTSPMIGEYCDSTPPDIITTSNEIFVHFYTNVVFTDIGFKMMYNPTGNLNTIGGRWYFGRVLVPLRLKNQSLYHKILLLQKFNYPLGKVLKPKKIQPPTSEKKNEAVFLFFNIFKLISEHYSSWRLPPGGS